MLRLDAATLVGCREMLGWVLRRRKRVKVTGRSMLPTLAPGDQVLVDPARPPQVGGLVVAHHPDDESQLIVKRVGEILANGDLVLNSDNPDEGTDSRRWGPIASHLTLGSVTGVFDRPEVVVAPSPNRQPPLAR